VLDFGNEWIESLSYAELAYNNSYQSSIGMAPFELCRDVNVKCRYIWHGKAM
jgi:hypothetical protein